MKQLLVYEQAVPLSSERHRDWSIQAGDDYRFASGLKAVPLSAVEIPAAAAEYVVVFVGSKEDAIPAVILGVREGENAYLNEKGGLDARYVPAFLRRYPFIFSSTDGGGGFTLCIDETFPGFNREGRGERLFDGQGGQTPYLKGVLAFLQDFEAQFRRTRAFCQHLRELDLLQPMAAQLESRSGDRIALRGFMTVSREKLLELSPDQLHSLARTGELELAYVTLQSLRGIDALMSRVTPLGSEFSTADDG